MGYCAVGNITAADWSRIKQLIDGLKKDMDAKLTDVSSASMKALEKKVEALALEVDSLETKWRELEARLSEVEKNAPMAELTTSEVLDMWRQADVEAKK